MIATPMYGGMCHGSFMKSMLVVFNVLQANGHKVDFVDVSNESLIHRARNALTELFLRSNFDYLLFIDADEGFDAPGILRMINENVDIISAPVPMKGINWERVKQVTKMGIEDIENHTAIWNFNGLTDEVVEINNAGTGLILIKRHVFEKMKPYVKSYRNNQPSLGSIQINDGLYNFWDLSIDESGQLLSEDYHFCKLWRNLGGKIYLAPYVKVTHAGTYWFR
jgi:glycosyltransferase involved in cell wall biosynthesis